MFNIKDKGIASFRNPSIVSASFETCVSNAKDYIPINRISSATILLGGTAGIRMLA